MPIVPIACIAVLLLASIKKIGEHERALIFTLSGFSTVKGPGIVFVIPIIERMARVNIGVQVIEVPGRDIITRDKKYVRINSTVSAQRFNPERHIDPLTIGPVMGSFLYSNNESFLSRTSEQTERLLRDLVNQHELDYLLTHRDAINREITAQFERALEVWIGKLHGFEIKSIDLPGERPPVSSRQN